MAVGVVCLYLFTERRVVRVEFIRMLVFDAFNTWIDIGSVIGCFFQELLLLFFCGLFKHRLHKATVLWG